MLTTSAMAEAQLRYNYIPDTISPAAQKTLATIYEGIRSWSDS